MCSERVRKHLFLERLPSPNGRGAGGEGELIRNDYTLCDLPDFTFPYKFIRK